MKRKSILHNLKFKKC